MLGGRKRQHERAWHQKKQRITKVNTDMDMDKEMVMDKVRVKIK